MKTIKQNTAPHLYVKAWQIVSDKSVWIFVIILQILYSTLTQITPKVQWASFLLVPIWLAILESGLIDAVVRLANHEKITYKDIWLAIKENWLKLLAVYYASIIIVMLPLVFIICVSLVFFSKTPTSIASIILETIFACLLFTWFGIFYVASRVVVIQREGIKEAIRKGVRIFTVNLIEYFAITILYVASAGIVGSIIIFAPNFYSNISAKAEIQTAWKIVILIFIWVISIPISMWASSIFTLTFLKRTNSDT